MPYCKIESPTQYENALPIKNAGNGNSNYAFKPGIFYTAAIYPACVRFGEALKTLEAFIGDG